MQENPKFIFSGKNKIDRTTKWGSPFAIGKDGSREEVLQKYRDYLKKRPSPEGNPRGTVRQSSRLLVLA